MMTRAVAVQFAFGGLFAPVDNLPVVNVANAGRSIPVKFSLGGRPGLDVTAAGYPTAQPVDCETLDRIGWLDPPVPPGRSGLRYAARNGWYSYDRQTRKEWAGTCRALVTQPYDGTEHPAYFQFK
jgi:hypothetical protein